MSHHQTRQPFELSDQPLMAPNGKSFGGRKAKIYRLLAETRRRQHRFRVGKALAPAGWVPLWALREPWSGGGQGDRRLRELRLYGYEIEVQNLPGADSTLYRLAGLSEPQRPEPDRAEADGPLAFLEVKITDSPAEGGEHLQPGHPLWPTGPNEQTYLAQLRRLHRTGRLCSRWTGRRTLSLSFAADSPLFVRRTWIHVLRALGARGLDSQQRNLTLGGPS